MDTLLNLEDISNEIGANNSTSVVDDFLNNNDFVRIRSRMDERRSIANEQIKSDQIKSRLCDRLREEKTKVVGLADRVKDLEFSDPEMFKYIQKLEFVQDGIWCQTCNKVKKIGGKPATNPTLEDENSEYKTQWVEKENEVRLNEAVTEISNNLNITKKQLTKLTTDYYNSLTKVQKMIAVLESELHELHSTTTLHESPNSVSLNSIKKEDLPGAPDFSLNLDKLIDKKYETTDDNFISSDELLNS